ncbi:MAG: hypothetical protein RR842_04055 [Gordonibacter sp.]|uniref:hypothetical protein n=1 Tax=Gordonibacter sp. TaxID=1968902 RepID=UPI002FC5C512
MKRLSAKQEAYCQSRATRATQKDAYRSAYSCSSMSDNAISVAASHLDKDPKITLRIAEIRNDAAKAIMWGIHDAALPLMTVLDAAIPAFQKDAKEGIIDNNARLAITESVKLLNEMFGVDGSEEVGNANVRIIDDIG